MFVFEAFSLEFELIDEGLVGLGNDDLGIEIFLFDFYAVGDDFEETEHEIWIVGRL